MHRLLVHLLAAVLATTSLACGARSSFESESFGEGGAAPSTTTASSSTTAATTDTASTTTDTASTTTSDTTSTTTTTTSTTTTTGTTTTTSTTTTGTTTTTTTTLPPEDVAPACLAFCDAVTSEASCYTVADCHVRCMAFRAAHAPACTAEAEALLGCLPDWLSPACQIGYPFNEPEGCGPAMNDLEVCADGALDSCTGVGAQLVGETACEGHATCAAGDAEITCTPNGKCTCFLDGDVVGTCAMPFTGTEPCVVTVTCCRPFFAP